MKWSMIDPNYRRMLVNGSVYKIWNPTEANVPPLSSLFPNHFIVSLRTKRMGTFYLMFSTQEELKKQSLTENENTVLEGNLVQVDEKKALFNVERVSEEEFSTYMKKLLRCRP